jgi:transposase
VKIDKILGIDKDRPIDRARERRGRFDRFRVPRQHSTGGKPRLGSISKMGNRHLRKLLVVGAHAALYSMKSGKTKTAMADWARSLLAKKPFKVVAVALANKMARIAWTSWPGP